MGLRQRDALQRLRHPKLTSNRRKRFDKFHTANMRLSRTFRSLSELQSARFDYDVFLRRERSGLESTLQHKSGILSVVLRSQRSSQNELCQQFRRFIFAQVGGRDIPKVSQQVRPH